MVEWWAAISGFERVFWFCAIPASAVLVIQMVMTFMGLDGEMDTDSDFSIDIEADADGLDVSVEGDVDGETGHDGGFPIFTFRNFVAFFTVFGWVGILMIRSGYSPAATLISSIMSGVAMMFLISLLFYAVGRLASTGGTYTLKQAIGKEGTVYIRVPKKGSGQGKVNVGINNQIRELDALTESEEDLIAGTIIRVSKIINGKLIVERA